jgi:hypothetical protein
LTADRTVVLHYHLFKNAGSSVDAILRRNFRDKWVSREFERRGGSNTASVEDWIRETPNAIAYSSHTMIGPLPEVEGVKIVSFMLLRDPIERIKSAYRFERLQQADTWGANLAKEHDFEGYVRARLARPGDRQCRDFQVHRLASLVPEGGTKMERALAALDRLTIVGTVDRFNLHMRRLAGEIGTFFDGFRLETVHANASDHSEEMGVSPELERTLLEENRLDAQVFRIVSERHSGHGYVGNVAGPQRKV